MPDDERRAPFSDLRSWVPARDERARERARAMLEARIAAAGAAPAPRPRRVRPRLPRSRGGWIAALAGTLVIAGAGAGAAAILLRTEHTGHLPVFTPQGTLSARFQVGARGRGSCWTASLATGAADAYRCMEGNAIHDPCFAASRRARRVACFIDPWHPLTLLTLDRPLPRHGAAPPGTLPWAIETVDGRRCTFLTGATAPMAGLRINYGCIGGSYLIGAPDREHPLWTIHASTAYHPDPPGRPVPLARYPPVGIGLTVP